MEISIYDLIEAIAKFKNESEMYPQEWLVKDLIKKPYKKRGVENAN